MTALQGVPQRQLKFVVQLWGDVAEEARAALPCSVLSYAELLARGAETSLQRVDLTEDDLATLVYTSGTTGNPRVSAPVWGTVGRRMGMEAPSAAWGTGLQV